MKVTASIAWVMGVAIVCIIACMTIVIVTGHDVTIFSIAIGLMLTSATGFVAMFHNQKKIGDTAEVTKRQTNGTLSRILDAYERSVARESVLAANAQNISVEDVASLHDETLSRDEINRIRERIGE